MSVEKQQKGFILIPKYLFGQNEIAWKNWLINNVVGSTLGKYGCTTTAYGVALGDYLGKPMNPKDTEIFIRNAGGYQGDLILWSKLPYFRQRFDCKIMPAPLEDIKKELRLGKYVLLQVDLVGNDDKPDHWVLCLDEYFTIFDPWFNEVAPITKRYGEPSREIFGGAYFNWIITNNINTMPTDLLGRIKAGKVNEYHLPDGTVAQLFNYSSREDYLAMGNKDENLINIEDARPQTWRERLDIAGSQITTLNNQLKESEKTIVGFINSTKEFEEILKVANLGKMQAETSLKQSQEVTAEYLKDITLLKNELGDSKSLIKDLEGKIGACEQSKPVESMTISQLFAILLGKLLKPWR